MVILCKMINGRNDHVLWVGVDLPSAQDKASILRAAYMRLRQQGVLNPNRYFMDYFISEPEKTRYDYARDFAVDPPERTYH